MNAPRKPHRAPRVPAPYDGHRGTLDIPPRAPLAPAEGIAPDAPTVRVSLEYLKALRKQREHSAETELPRCQRVDAAGNRCDAPCKLSTSDRTEHPVWVHVSVRAWLNDPHTAEV